MSMYPFTFSSQMRLLPELDGAGSTAPGVGKRADRRRGSEDAASRSGVARMAHRSFHRIPFSMMTPMYNVARLQRSLSERVRRLSDAPENRSESGR